MVLELRSSSHQSSSISHHSTHSNMPASYAPNPSQTLCRHEGVPTCRVREARSSGPCGAGAEARGVRPCAFFLRPARIKFALSPRHGRAPHSPSFFVLWVCEMRDRRRFGRLGFPMFCETWTGSPNAKLFSTWLSGLTGSAAGCTLKPLGGGGTYGQDPTRNPCFLRLRYLNLRKFVHRASGRKTRRCRIYSNICNG